MTSQEEEEDEASAWCFDTGKTSSQRRDALNTGCSFELDMTRSLQSLEISDSILCASNLTQELSKEGSDVTLSTDCNGGTGESGVTVGGSVSRAAALQSHETSGWTPKTPDVAPNRNRREKVERVKTELEKEAEEREKTQQIKQDRIERVREERERLKERAKFDPLDSVVTGGEEWTRRIVLLQENARRLIERCNDTIYSGLMMTAPPAAQSTSVTSAKPRRARRGGNNNNRQDGAHVSQNSSQSSLSNNQSVEDLTVSGVSIVELNDKKACSSRCDKKTHENKCKAKLKSTAKH